MNKQPNRISDAPKILVLDIETKPAKAYVWKLFDENIGLDQLIDDGGVLCIGAKWVGSPVTYFFSEWGGGQEVMLRQIHSMLVEADAVVTYNGDKFDLPKLNAEFIQLRLPPIPPLTSIDLYKQARKLGFLSKKLGFVGPYLKVGQKLKNAGFELWRDVIEGSKKAQREMQEYCLGDVELTEKVYMILRPYIKNHPHLGEAKSQECGACGGTHLHSRGYRRTKAFRIQRLQCQSCGAWSDGRREKM